MQYFVCIEEHPLEAFQHDNLEDNIFYKPVHKIFSDLVNNALMYLLEPKVERIRVFYVRCLWVVYQLTTKPVKCGWVHPGMDFIWEYMDQFAFPKERYKIKSEYIWKNHVYRMFTIDIFNCAIEI